MATTWACHAPVPQESESQLLGLSNGVSFVFVLLQLSEIIKVKVKNLKNCTFYKVKFRLQTLTSIISESCSSTKTNYIPFESPNSWLLDSWGTGAWQAQAVATPFSPEKYTFYKQRAWQAYEPATPLSSRNLKANYQGFQMIYHLFLYYFKFLIYRVKCKILPRPNPNNMVPSVLFEK